MPDRHCSASGRHRRHTAESIKEREKKKPKKEEKKTIPLHPDLIGVYTVNQPNPYNKESGVAFGALAMVNTAASKDRRIEDVDIRPANRIHIPLSCTTQFLA